jgi:hypothetical protein
MESNMTSKIKRRQAIRPLLSALVLGSVFLVGACETPVASQRLPDITFAHMPVFRIDVASVDVDNRFTPPLKAPHIEHRLSTTPAQALAQWAKDRIKPVGQSGKLRLLIEDASAVEATIGRDKSLKGHFTKQQSHRYDFAVRATLLLTDASGIERGTATATASRSITVREDISLNEREKTWFQVVDRLLADFNSEMEANLRQHLASWLR